MIEFILSLFDSFWFESIFKLVLGFLLAGLIGLERSSWNKPAGFRTHALVGLSGVLIMLCGQYLAQHYNMDPSRIPAQLLSGIGFIGAGTILRDGFNVKGLTTAAGLLSVTCIGLSIGAGFYVGGIVTTLIVYLILSSSYKVSDKLDHFAILDLQISADKDSEDVLNQIEKVLTDYEVDIKQMKKDSENDDLAHSATFRIVFQYNRRQINKNELIKNISLIPNVCGVTET